MVSRFLLEGLGELNPDVVDEVFAPGHALSSPEFGTQVITGTRIIKSAIEEFLNEAGRIECTIQRQVEEGEWVATSYTLTEESDVHMGGPAQPRRGGQDYGKLRRGKDRFGGAGPRHGQEGL